MSLSPLDTTYYIEIEHGQLRKYLVAKHLIKFISTTVYKIHTQAYTHIIICEPGL
jgi:hypothetical protein